MQNELNQTVPTNSSYSQGPSGSLPTIVIVYIAMSVVVVAINITVIYLFATRRYLRTPVSNIFLFNLALSDLFYGLVTLPLCIACMTQYGKFCYAYYFFMIFTGYLSVYDILLGIIEKFFAVCFPVKHYQVFTRSLIIKLCLSLWILSAVIAHIPLWWYVILEHPDQYDMKVKFNIFQFISVFGIPVIASVIMYTMMLHRISKQLKARASIKGTNSVQQKRAFRLKKERKIALIFGLVFTVFLVCWTGWFVLTNFFDQILGNNINYDSKIILIRFVFIMRILAAILNPLLYTFIKKDFQNALRSLVFKQSELNQDTTTQTAFLEQAENGDEIEITL